VVILLTGTKLNKWIISSRYDGDNGGVNWV